MKYKNISSATLAIYGVTFGPGEVKEVPGAINAPQFVHTDEPVTETKPEQPSVEITTEPQKRGAKSTSQKKEASSDGQNND